MFVKHVHELMTSRYPLTFAKRSPTQFIINQNEFSKMNQCLEEQKKSLEHYFFFGVTGQI